MIDRSSIAARRFGLGPKPGDLAAIRSDPRGYVLSQLARPQALVLEEGVPSSEAALRRLLAFNEWRNTMKSGRPQTGLLSDENVLHDPRPASPAEIGVAETMVRVRLAIDTPTPLVERLTAFWANHFCVSVFQSNVVRVLAGVYERESIRPHVLGRFRDMLLAVMQSPAMLQYLDNVRSIGPNSPSGRRTGRGLNENLAREALELHTVGVNGGYDQDDIVNLARALTGWTFTGTRNPKPAQFRFIKSQHEPGSVTVMGRVYDQEGVEQAERILDDLARHPATARHLAVKLARHFVSEAPPQALVDRLERTFLDTEGDLKAVTSALVEDESAWSHRPSKLLPPYDYLVSVFRAVGQVPADGLVTRTLRTFGQPHWGVPSPAGWSDDDMAWAAPKALLERVDWAKQISRRMVAEVSEDVLAWAEDVTGDALSPATREAIARAESRRQAIVLLLVSPEFQRR